MLTIGLDVHFSKSRLCVLDDQGKLVRDREVRGHWDALAGELKRIKEPFRICYEASLGYGHLYQTISGIPQARQVLVAHPGQLRLIFKAKRKNDRVDARKLATLLYLDQVPQVHVPGQDVQSWRAMIHWRVKLVHHRTAVKNQIRALLKTCGIVPLQGKKLWSKAGSNWIGQQVLPTEYELLRLEMLMDELTQLNGKIKRVEDTLNKIAGKHPGVALLMSIPGVGIRTAEAFVAHVDNPVRFTSSYQAGVYFGLVPCQDASASQNRLGHITGEGPALARKLLTEAAWQGTLRSPAIKAHFEKITQGKNERRKIALVATARWLSCVMLAMLKSGECWREEFHEPAMN